MSHLTCLTSLLLLLQAQPTPTQDAPTVEPEKPRYDVGPLRIDVTAMREIRLKYMEDAERGAKESNFAMQLRLSGERIKEVSRYGMVILDEMVDDTGHAMVNAETYSDRERTELRDMRIPEDRLKETGLFVVTRAGTSAPGASKIAKLKGTVRLVFADDAEKLTILNPIQYAGKTLDDPRLKELGLEIYVAPATDLEKSPPGAFVALITKTKEEHLKGVSFFDGNMQAVRYRPNPVTTNSGESGMAYLLDPAALTNELQMVLEVHEKVEEMQFPIELKDVDLP